LGSLRGAKLENSLEVEQLRREDHVINVKQSAFVNPELSYCRRAA
jgi:hypothetical protein